VTRLVEITLAPGNQRLSVPAGTELKELLHRFGVEFPCGGRGHCGACRIRVVDGTLPPSEACREWLTQAETDAGWRFACRHVATSDLRFELAHRELAVLTEHAAIAAEAQEGTAVAVDLGTTTLVAQLLDLRSGRVLAVATSLNPQVVHGADLMTRVEFGLRDAGRRQLTKSIRREVGRLIDELLAAAPADGDLPSRILIAGNTVMHHLFCGLDLATLSRPPFEGPHSGSRLFEPEALAWNLPVDTEIRFLPCLGGFVGSDILAGILATGMHQSEELIGLADLGTNGEIAIGNRDGILCASTAAGPAFEAGGISQGMRAATGAIIEVEALERRVSCKVLGGGPALGICGSGLVDAIAVGLSLGRIEANGRLHEEHRPFQLRDAVSISQHDVRQLQLAKAAIAAGISVLLERSGSKASEIATFYLAGAFGNYVKVDSALRIGLLDVSPDRIQAAGNTSLHGIKLALLSKDFHDRALIPTLEKARHVSLASDADFQDCFIRATAFPDSWSMENSQ
jgi:uncharacterized 2Fe-2S/4Fe-4S cluster protein (DUF4445 family)